MSEVIRFNNVPTALSLTVWSLSFPAVWCKCHLDTEPCRRIKGSTSSWCYNLHLFPFFQPHSHFFKPVHGHVLPFLQTLDSASIPFPPFLPTCFKLSPISHCFQCPLCLAITCLWTDLSYKLFHTITCCIFCASENRGYLCSSIVKCWRTSWNC